MTSSDQRRAPIAVALDSTNLEVAAGWAAAAADWVSTMKIGLQFYLRHGANGVARIRKAAPTCDVFLDLKLLDIPNTVRGAAEAVAPLAPDIVTVHALGGSAVVGAAVDALPQTQIAAVTVLTSMTPADLASVGLVGTPDDAVRRLAGLAATAGARALVCSPREIAIVRAEVGTDLTLITPGVRPAGSANGDQARTATPEQALAAGADLLVVGRPITGAVDPGAAAKAIAETLMSVSGG